MKKTLIAALAICCLAVGAVAGRWWAWQSYSQLSDSKDIKTAQMIEVMVAEPLAELRLGETNQAIAGMESFMDDQVLVLAYFHDTAGLDENARKKIERSLSPAKVYHESYPVSGDDAASINAMLAKVPGRSPQSICKSGVCRLDDLRLAKLRVMTNAP